MNPLPEIPPLTVLDHFAPHTRGLAWARAPGGFSGARVWRGTSQNTPLVALKAWSIDTSAEHVRQVHSWIARAAHLPFVPRVFAGAGGHTVFVEAGRVWDCVRWMPGAPRSTPTTEEVARACEAVAQLHSAWAFAPKPGPCPGVLNRLRVLEENAPLLAAGPKALPPVAQHLDALLQRALTVSARLAPLVTRSLRVWGEHTFALQPCVRDLRGEHVLFEDARVSGIIDFGAANVDHPAGDIARLLTDFAGTDETLFSVGVNAYRGARPAFDAPDEFVRVLARSGAVCSLIGWLVRFAVRREVFADPLAVAARLDSLLVRVEEFSHI